MYIVSVFGFLLTVCVTINADGCVWYDQCYYHIEREHWKNCDYTGPPKPINDWPQETKELFHFRCPDLFPDVNLNIDTCCSPSQVYEIDKNIKLAEGIIKRCPTCLNNMVRHICAFTCGGDQQNYAVTHTVPMNETHSYVDVLDINMKYEYMEGAYNSCAGVVVPQSGNLAMDMLCGYYGAADCTPERWMNSMGDVELIAFVPFQINYITSDDDNALNPRTVPCNEVDSGLNNGLICSCVDCEASCTFELILPELSEICKGTHCTEVIIAIIICLALSGVFIGISLGGCCKKRKPGIIGIIDSKPKRRRFVFHGFNNFMEKMFFKIGVATACQPTLVIMVISWIIIALGMGLFYIEIIKNPVELWSTPTSTVRQQKDFFDTRFGPFYRTEQIFFKTVGLSDIVDPDDANITYGSAFNQTFLQHIIDIQTEILKIGVEKNAGFDKICYAPLRSPFTGPNTIEQCVIMSFFGYFQYNLDDFNNTNYLKTILNCMGNSYEPSCLAPWGGGVEASLAFGGENAINIRNADTVIITFITKNHLHTEDLKPALEWESKFIEFMKNYEKNVKPDYVDVSYNSERSVEDEIERLSGAEMVTVIISYVAMFIYVAFSLGNIRSYKTIMLDSKISLALVGIIIVLSAVLCSLGFFGYVGVPTTLLTMQVLPFLVLAIGVDNIFILAASYNDVCIAIQDGSLKLDHDDSKDKRKKKLFIFGKTVGKVGPSMVLTTASQCVCFGIGSLSGMPAVSTFAQYAAMAIFFDFVFQITAFVAFLSYDYTRYESGRLDVFCCVMQKQCCGQTDEKMYTKGLVHKLIKLFYIPLIFNKFVKPIIAIGFMVWLGLSIVVIPHIEIGLDQEVAMPRDSFVRKYLLSVGSLLQVGPPVYWVVTQGLDYHKEEHQNFICGGVMCDEESMLTTLYSASKSPDRTFLTRPPSSWIDNYFIWATSQSCCKYFYSNDSFCPHQDATGECGYCDIGTDELMLRPNSTSFQKYLSYFLMDNPDAECANSGHPSYGPGLNYIYSDNGGVNVRESYFMGYHKTLRGSKEFYESYRFAKDMGINLTQTLRNKSGNNDIEVFPYSIHYVFYEQYLTMWQDTIKALGYSLLVVLVVSFIFTGLDLFSSVIILILVTMILIDIMGFMYWWNISLNAVSLVNLVMGIGIAVEFCSHIVHSFAKSEEESENRVKQALIDMGSNVLIGITLTNFPAIVVLAFSQSDIFEIYYFRMFLLIVVVGAAHGLIFLPVFLHYLTQFRSFFNKSSK